MNNKTGFIAEYSVEFHEYSVFNNGELFCHLSELAKSGAQVLNKRLAS